MPMLLRDLRHAVRSLVRAPGFTAAAALTLALGIGADTAVFSVVDALLLRPLPYQSPDRLVMVWDQLPKLGLDQFPAPFFNYFEYKQRNQVFEDIAAFHFDELNLSGSSSNAAPERIEAMVVSANLFPVLGVAPQLGRGFTAEENQPGREASIILSHALWTRRFGAEHNLLGQMLRINDRLLRVVGIMPPSFQFTIRSGPSPDA